MGRALDILVECSCEQAAYELAGRFAKTLCECGINFKHYAFNKIIILGNNDIFRFVRWDDEDAHRGFRGKVVDEYDIEKYIYALPLMRKFYDKELLL